DKFVFEIVGKGCHRCRPEMKTARWLGGPLLAWNADQAAAPAAIAEAITDADCEVGLLSGWYWIAMIPPTAAFAVVRVSEANTYRSCGSYTSTINALLSASVSPAVKVAEPCVTGVGLDVLFALLPLAVR